MEENISHGLPLTLTHLLQQTLRSMCVHENSPWVYAVFWRILPRNYPPPKWDVNGGGCDRSRGNRRNWILVWEDGFCDFSATISDTAEMRTSDCASSSLYTTSEFQHSRGLQPELFFKMSHEIYNYGEGLIGKVASDHSHKWIFKEPQDHEINFLSSWHSPADSHPRTWEAQFQSGIQTIALIAVREGVIQLGAANKVMEDLNYVVLLRKKFSYLGSIPGVLLPHPSSAAFPLQGDGGAPSVPHNWPFQPSIAPDSNTCHPEYHDYLSSMNPNFHGSGIKIMPSMTSLEALLSKLPSVEPSLHSASSYCGPASSYCGPSPLFASNTQGIDKMKEEENDEYGNGGESSTAVHLFRHR
ncbi:transcription factor EMB1444 [Amborella trichopoda]|uniref:Transcription factor MYC/MYB N-terminal domain-containing protein n=1 Tax=Amborella trichopoda TaxID=13333 RepID=W1NV84_AMBTC|nr:transcription factor EMB1444 [Amborella trichopoda]ERM99527.1 hypothetical protein AMTR_s00088p00074360 [Amborella trichopoda]|eukprot:XP_006836674.1 transcription factor EMB1444 [Amborella trichopoda]